MVLRKMADDLTLSVCVRFRHPFILHIRVHSVHDCGTSGRCNGAYCVDSGCVLRFFSASALHSIPLLHKAVKSK